MSGFAPYLLSILLGHSRIGFWPLLNMGTPAVLFCFLWLHIWAAGPGPLSLDAALRGIGRTRT
jgi:putative oxidoreductase